jgi:hypothetical protein
VLRNLTFSYSQKIPPPLVEPKFHYRVFQGPKNVSNLSQNNRFYFCQKNLDIRLNIIIFPTSVPSQWTHFVTLIQQSHIVKRKQDYISLIQGIRVLMGLQIADCMNQTFLRNSQSLSSVKIFHFVSDKAIFQYTFHNSKSLSSHGHNKSDLQKINVTESENS